MLIAAGATLLVLGGVVLGFVILLSGAMSTSATTQHFLVTHRLLDLGLQYSVRTGALAVEAPALDSPGMVEQGAACYRAHCAQCHGAPGEPPQSHTLGLLPVPGNLAQAGREWPAEWLYHVTRKGIRMTGMPAWEFRLSDQSLWSTTAFLRQLQYLDAEEYRRLAPSSSEALCTPASELSGPSSPRMGRIVLSQYGCHGCHRIDGVVGPRNHIGPPLVDWSRRKYIAGVVPNTRENLVRWIRDPGAVSPGTLMPDLGVSEAHAYEMARYLFSQE
jgi:mono/diheme cytochrome c family protein